MPIYEYQCKKCGHQTELWQKFSDPPLSRCDQCNGKMKKLISQSTFHLKGSGWYVTDYASKSDSNNTSSTNTGESTKKEPSEKGKKETKSTEKTSPKADSKSSTKKKAMSEKT
jgi:putative FmdB family regulatory protein